MNNFIVGLILLELLFIVNSFKYPSYKIINNKNREDIKWDYERYGAAYWPYLDSIKPNDCNKLNTQSPINIDDNLLSCDSSLIRSIEFFNYEKNINYIFNTNGRTIFAEASNTNRYSIEIQGSGLPIDYSPFILEQFHFHWGFNYYEGSEHFINDEKYPLEIHFVHRSFKNSSYLAVLSVLARLSDTPNNNLNDLLDAISYFNNNNDSVIRNLNLSQILSLNTNNNDNNKFYYYLGSLTTPPCTTNVHWTILQKQINISKEQLNIFYENKLIKHNYRYTQKLGKRVVFTNDYTKCDTFNSGGYLNYNCANLFCLLILFLFL